MHSLSGVLCSVSLVQFMSSVQGTGPYMAPEQHIATEVGVTPAADMWGFGATMVHMMSGKAPEERYGHAMPELPWKVKQVPRLAELLRSCFHRDPGARPTAGTALQVVEGIIAAQVRLAAHKMRASVCVSFVYSILE